MVPEDRTSGPPQKGQSHGDVIREQVRSGGLQAPAAGWLRWGFELRLKDAVLCGHCNDNCVKTLQRCKKMVLYENGRIIKQYIHSGCN